MKTNGRRWPRRRCVPGKVEAGVADARLSLKAAASASRRPETGLALTISRRETTSVATADPNAAVSFSVGNRSSGGVPGLLAPDWTAPRSRTLVTVQPAVTLQPRHDKHAGARPGGGRGGPQEAPELASTCHSGIPIRAAEVECLNPEGAAARRPGNPAGPAHVSTYFH